MSQVNATLYRVERDSLGPVNVPIGALYGAHTARSLVNFPLTGIPISTCPELIRTLARIKRAACATNEELGLLPLHVAGAVKAACGEVAEGLWSDHFPIDVLQGGAGTSTNMNLNEVIANRALQILGHEPGHYSIVSPIDHVNKCQSTNDSYATAVRLATHSNNGILIDALQSLIAVLYGRSVSFEGVVKLGRTQLQDAVPIPFNAEIAAFAATLEKDVIQFTELSTMFLEINMGGTAVGSGIGANEEYRRRIVSSVASEFELPLRAAANLYEASWDVGAFVLYSGMLKRLAAKLSKIASDIRLLSSGPRGGFGELNIPERQAGSSIMPGKLNPVIPEAVNQVAFRVFGLDTAITFASEAGQLQLNAFEPLIFSSTREATLLLASGIAMFERNCVGGISPNHANAERNLHRSTASATEAAETLGYEQAASIARLAIKADCDWNEAVARWSADRSSEKDER